MTEQRTVGDDLSTWLSRNWVFWKGCGIRIF